MQTLYDLLGALPRDDADELRSAFRRAVKGTHPDLHPGDPEAAQRFREIVRANDILGDSEQRAAYDHLLVLAGNENKRHTGTRFRKTTSAMAALVVTAGIGTIACQVSPRASHSLMHLREMVLVSPSDFAGLSPKTMQAKTEPAAVPVEAASVLPVTRVQTISVAPPRAVELASAAPDVPVPVAAVPQADIPPATVGPPLEITPSSDVLIRLQKVEHAFADIAPARRTDPSKRTAPDARPLDGKSTAKKPKPPQPAASSSFPLFPNRTAKLEGPTTR